MRLFVAVVPPEPALAELAEFLEPRHAAVAGPGGVRVRWATPEQWHLTLAFLPQVSERVLDDLGARLERAAAKRFPPTLALAGAGAFPHPAGARVIWSGVTATPLHHQELTRLATGCRAAGARAGAEVSGSRFRPHLTLARLGRPGNVIRWLGVLEAFRGSSWVADEVSLVHSQLGQGPGGRPRYQTLATLALSAAPPPDPDDAAVPAGRL